MKKIVVAWSLLLCSTSAKAVEWNWSAPTKVETLQIVTVESLILIDVLQTLDLKRHPTASEVNPLLGEHPSDARLIMSAAVAGSATFAAWYVLPSRIRWIVPLLVGTGEILAISGNVSAGMKIRF